MNSIYSQFFRQKHWPLLVLVIVPFLLYKRSLSFDFSPMDEQWMIEDNGWFISKWSNFKAAFTGPTSFLIYYRPLFVVSTMVDYSFGKLDPFVYHFTTVLWHLGCVVLFFELLLRFQTEIRLAFFIALAFAVHPIMLHAVAWIPGRNDSMLCFFMLGSLIFLIDYIDTSKLKYVVLHLFFFICGLLTKETAIVFPLVYAAILYLRQGSDKIKLLKYVAIWLVLTTSWFFIRRSFVGEIQIPGTSLTEIARHSIAGFLVYFGKVLFPFQQSVFPVLKHASVLPGIFTLFVFVLLWWRFKPVDQRTALFGCFLFFTLLIVPLVFTAMKSNGELYEHRLYAPMTGIFLFISRLRMNSKTALFSTVSLVLVLAFLVITFKRMEVYKSKLAFLNAGIESYPEYYYFYLEKGQILDHEGNYQAAIASFDAAMQRNPTNSQVYFDRGNAFFSLGNKSRSISDYTSALEYSKGKLRNKVLMQRCIAYEHFNEPELALKDLDVLKVCCPDLIEKAFEKELHKKIEIVNWNKKVEASPRNAEIYLMRGMFFAEHRMNEEALSDFKKATELEPGNQEYKEFYRRVSSQLAPTVKRNSRN